MAWTAPITFTNGDPLTAAQLNTFVRDNMLETGPGKSVVRGRMLVTENVNDILERQWVRDYQGGHINQSDITLDRPFPVTEDQEGTEYGPSVTVQHGGTMLLMYDARIQMTAEGPSDAVYAPVIDGQRPQNTHFAVRSGREGGGRWGAWWLWKGEPGLSYVTMAYGISGPTGRTDDDGDPVTARYAGRRLTVIPF